MTATTQRPKSCTQAEFARLQGWTPPYVTALKKAGRLVFDVDGLVDVERSIARIQQTTQSPERASAAAVSEAGRSDKERQAYYAAELARLDLEERVGALLGASDVESALADAGTVIRTTLEAWADRLSPALANLGGDERRIRAELSEQVEDVLHELARKFAAATKPAGGTS